MNIQSLSRIVCCLSIFGTLSIACSDSSTPSGGTGGAKTGGVVTSSSGGSVPSTGGKGTGGETLPSTGGKATGGASPATGGEAAPSTGGKSTGGASPATGGNGTGGLPSAGGAAPATGGQSSVDAGSATDGRTPGRDGAMPGTDSRATGGAPGTGGSPPAGDAGSTGGTGLAGAAVPSDGCGKATTATTGKNQTITVGTSSRTYNLFIPTNYDNSHPYRLIVSYHWLNGTAANVSDGSSTAAAWYGQNTTSTGGGSTIFVAPQGLNNGWSNSGGADVTFSRTLITQLETQLCVDKARIFAEGFSMGGSMSYAIASAAPEIFRAVAVHSGGSMSGSTNGHSKPVAYFMTHGTKDSVCTWPGYGLPQLQDFAKVNGCKTPDPTQSASAFQAALPQPTSNQGVCLDFTGCTAGYPTRSCLFVGDHTPSPDGTTGWVPKETWKFFSQF